jgi:hypothetical protein
MTRRRTITITVEPDRVLVSGYRAAEVLRGSGMRPIYLGTVQAWVLDRKRLGDVLAAFDHRRIPTEVTERGAAG